MSRCRDRATVTVLDLEGYAMVGKIRDVRIGRCSRDRWYIEVVLDSGEVLCTDCLDRKAVELSKRVLDFYRVVPLSR